MYVLQKCSVLLSVFLVFVQARRSQLQDSIRQFSLFRECDEVEAWIKERVSAGKVPGSVCQIKWYLVGEMGCTNWHVFFFSGNDHQGR